MSKDRSPEQQDPEQRIAELERGLADAKYTAAQQRLRPPGQDYGAAARPNATWMPPPAQSGYPPAYMTPAYTTPAYTTPGWAASQWRGPRLWIWILMSIVVFAGPLIGVVAFAIPWGSMNLFGPTQVPRGGTLTVEGNNGSRTVACNDGYLRVDGRAMTVTVTGHCAHLWVAGLNSHVTVDSADAIDGEGVSNVVTFHSGSPQISNTGINVTVQQG